MLHCLDPGVQRLLIVVGREEDDEVIRPFVAKHGYTVPFAGDPEMVAYSRYATRFIPRNFVIGPDGTVLYQSQGYAPGTGGSSQIDGSFVNHCP